MSGSTIPQADVEIVLDLRDLAHAPSSPSDLGALWAAVEPELVGRDMRPGQVHELTSDDGVVRLEVVHAVRRSGPVRPSTRYSIVGVREAPHIRYRCRPCSSSGTVRYGPFICGECGADTADNRVCDTHVSILDGALVATCDDHRPGCTECGRPSTFRCAGDRCRRAGPWGGKHPQETPPNKQKEKKTPIF